MQVVEGVWTARFAAAAAALAPPLLLGVGAFQVSVPIVVFVFVVFVVVFLLLALLLDWFLSDLGRTPLPRASARLPLRLLLLAVPSSDLLLNERLSYVIINPKTDSFYGFR